MFKRTLLTAAIARSYVSSTGVLLCRTSDKNHDHTPSFSSTAFLRRLEDGSDGSCFCTCPFTLDVVETSSGVPFISDDPRRFGLDRIEAQRTSRIVVKVEHSTSDPAGI